MQQTAANLRSLTAEAAVDYLDNDTLDKAYTIDLKSDSESSEKSVIFIDNGDEITAYVASKKGSADAYYTVDSLTKLANGESGAIGYLTAAPTAPTGGKVINPAS